MMTCVVSFYLREALDKEIPFLPTFSLFVTRALRKVLWRKKYGIGIKLSPRATKISCLLFANDSLLFSRTNIESCKELSSILNRFCQRSGYLINFQKSSLTFSSNAKAHDKQSVSSIFNITL